MLDRYTELYFGNQFEKNERRPLSLVLKMLEDGEVEEARMPRPTNKRPDRTRLVYRWKGERTFDHRDLSAQMPPCVTELAAEGIGTFTALADSWRGHQTPAFRRLRNLPVGVRLLVNPVGVGA